MIVFLMLQGWSMIWRAWVHVNSRQCGRRLTERIAAVERRHRSCCSAVDSVDYSAEHTQSPVR